MLAWLGFIACTTIIFLSGTQLSKYGDVLSEKTGLGRTWIGVVMMASVTSLPELVTGVSSVTYANAPDIAVGDVFGSCVFNILIIAFLDLLYRPTPISARAHYGQTLSAVFGILLLSIATLSILLSDLAPPLGWIGPYSIVFVFVYLISMRLVFSYERKILAAAIKEEKRYGNVSLKTAVTRYGINAAIVALAATVLPPIGKSIAVSSGLGQTFVGTIFIALSTSLPEVVISIGAVRIGAVDLAIGNLFGSNLFDILILAIDDFLYTGGPLLDYIDIDHSISAISAIAMTAIACIGLIYRADKKRLFLAWDAIGIVTVYIVNLMLLYTLSHH